jgi:predicted small lipoprotein YifL
MRRVIKRCLLVLAVSSLVAACGGGGGGTTTPAPTPTPTPTKKASTVSGTVALVSLNSLVSKRAEKISVRKAAGDDAAQISIRSYDSKNVELGKYNLTTGTTGAFAQDVDLSESGGYVIITATKAGYADFSKRVDYTSPSALNLRAELAKVTTGAGTADAANSNMINIGVVRRSSKVRPESCGNPGRT